MNQMLTGVHVPMFARCVIIFVYLSPPLSFVGVVLFFLDWILALSNCDEISNGVKKRKWVGNKMAIHSVADIEWHFLWRCIMQIVACTEYKYKRNRAYKRKRAKWRFALKSGFLNEKTRHEIKVEPMVCEHLTKANWRKQNRNFLSCWKCGSFWVQKKALFIKTLAFCRRVTTTTKRRWRRHTRKWNRLLCLDYSVY